MTQPTGTATQQGPPDAGARRAWARPRGSGAVTTLELFFDLVFVFALTQVTQTMADDLTPGGLLRGVLVVAVLWWCWTGYAWLGNLVEADEGLARLGLLAAMAAMFVLALTIPEAFEDFEGGLSGPVVLAVCYFLVRALHLVLFALFGRDDPALQRQLLLFTPSMLAGTALLLVAAGADGAAQTWLWGAALAADYVGTWLGGARGWRLRSPQHFAERHGLIVIVALGESIVAIGVGVAQAPVSWPIVLGSVLGLALAGGLWWAYFDVTALVAEHALADAPEGRRAAMARDAYSFLHLPLVAGVVLLALGLKKTLEYAGEADDHPLSDPLGDVALWALAGGVLAYLLAHVAFKLRTVGSLSTSRLVAAAAVVPVAVAGTRLPALATLGLLTAVVAALVAFEAVRYAEARDRVRHHGASAPH